MPRLLLAALFALLAAAPALHAQSVIDSVRVSYSVLAPYRVIQSDNLPGGYGVECSAGLWGDHPDFAGTLVGLGSYTYSGLPEYTYFYPFSSPVRPPGMVRFNLYYGAIAGGHGEGCGALVAAAQADTGTVTWAIHSYPNGVPVAKFDTTRSEGLTRGFDGSASFEAVAGRRVPVAGYRWTFGDGSPEQTSVAPSHTYAAVGSYRVTLEVTDDDGQKDAYSRNVTVARPGLRVWAEAQTAGQEYRRNDAVYVVGYIENRSAEEVTDVRVPNDFSLGVIYPANVQPLPKQPPSYRRISDGANPSSPPPRRDTTIAVLGPGERAEIVQIFNVDTYAQYRPRPNSNFVATGATGYPFMQGVTGRDAQGQPVAVEQRCGFGPCGNTWEVRPTVQVRLEYRTDDRVTTEVRAGLVYNSAHDAADLLPYNLPRAQPFQYAFVDGELKRFCHTACANFRVVVADSLTGEPIENARVVVTAVALRPVDASVTPGHSGGHLCVPGVLTTCGPTQTLTTDENGRAEGFYSFPGIIEPTVGGINAVVFEEGQGQAMADISPPLQLVPNERTDFRQETTLSVGDADFLSAITFSAIAGALGNAPAEGCEGLAKGAGGGFLDYIIRPGNSRVLHGGVSVLSEWACEFFELPTLGAAGGVKDFAETALIAWFSTRFTPPDGGLGDLVGPFPPPFVFKWDGDYYDAIIEGMIRVARDAAPGTRLRLSLHEVSWQQTGLFTAADGTVPNVHFALTATSPGGAVLTHEALIELAYDPQVWLGANGPQNNVDRLAAEAAAEATRLHVAEQVERFRRGDFVTLDAGTPTAESVQVTGVSGGRAPDGTTGARLAAGPYEVTLSRRLRFAHPSGAEVLVYRDSLGVFPPRAPVRLPADTVATARPVMLAWYVGLFETPETFDVQVARDTTFATLLMDAPGLTARTVETAAVQNGERIYWRVRAANQVGVGPWSPPGLIVGSDLATAGEDGAPAAAFELGRPFPNPALGAATVPLSVPTAQRVWVEVVDALGRRVAVLHDGELAAGTTVLRLDAARLAPGVYIVRAVAGDAMLAQRLTVVR